MIDLWPLLLPVAACSGWWFAYRYYVTGNRRNKHVALSHEYIVGLNYLLNEQPDKAVDIFIKLLEVDSDTVETHLALGSLFRRRGEVDRAIRVHQNLVARPQLTIMQHKNALMALGQDYLSAGLFDRSEQIFLQVLEVSGGSEASSLRGLLTIYQQEKAWDKAIDIARKLESTTGAQFNIQAAHYYCEKANQALKANDEPAALANIKQALQIDKGSVRASLMLSSIKIKHCDYKQAIKVLKRIPEQDASFVTEIITPLVQCYHEIGAMDECIAYLEPILMSHPRGSVIFVIGDYWRREHSDDYAIDFVSDQLRKHPSIKGLNKLIYWHLEVTHGKVRDKLQMLYDITSRFLEDKPVYRCGHCGLGGKLLHWLCPSCKQWGSVKPIHGLEGD